MKKLLGVLILGLLTCTFAAAEEISEVCASHILLPTESDAVKLRSQITSYTDFQRYARLYSICPSAQYGGNLGCFTRGKMDTQFEEAAFNGKIGEVSEPVKTQFGYHLIWVYDKH